MLLDSLPVGRQKFCLGRWIAIRAVAEQQLVFLDLGVEERAHNLSAERRAELEHTAARRCLEAATRNALEDDHEPVQVFLERMPAVVRLDSRSEGSERYASAVEHRVAAYLAAPTDPFSQVFGICEDVARWFYHEQHLLSGVTRGELSVSPHGRPRRLSMGPVVGGATRVEHPADGAVAGVSPSTVVTLKLTGEDCWRPEFCAMPYVLLHELVVHAFAAPHAATSTDGFAEGWMDFVVHQLHERLALEDAGVPPEFFEHFGAGEQRYHGRLLHAARSDGRRVIRENAIVADNAQTCIARHHGEDMARRSMWAFSAALNQSPVKPSKRAEACEQLGRAVRANTPEADEWIDMAVALLDEPIGSNRIDMCSAFVRDLCRG